MWPFWSLARKGTSEQHASIGDYRTPIIAELGDDDDDDDYNDAVACRIAVVDLLAATQVGRRRVLCTPE